MRTAARSVQWLVIGLKSSHAEISDLDVQIAIHENVFRLEISVADVEPMAIRQSSEDLSQYADSLLFWKITIPSHMIKKLATLNVLQDEVS